MDIVVPTTRRCQRCQRDLPFEHYYPRKDAKDGRRNTCRDCVRAERAHPPQPYVPRRPTIPDIGNYPAEVRVVLAVIAQAHRDAKLKYVPREDEGEFGDPSGWLAELQASVPRRWNDRAPAYRRKRNRL